MLVIYIRCVNTAVLAVNVLQIPEAVERFATRKLKRWRMMDESATRAVAEQLQEKLLREVCVNGVPLPVEVIDMILRFAGNNYWIALMGMF